MIRLSEEAHLNEPDFNIDEGFKIVLWRPSAATGQVPDKHRASTGQITDHDTDYDTDHDTDHVDELVKRLLLVLSKPKGRPELMIALDLRHNPNFRDNYLRPAMEAGYIEMTLPDKPQSTKQRYRLTEKGVAIKKSIENK